MGLTVIKREKAIAEFVQEESGDEACAVFDIVVYPEDHPSFFTKRGHARKRVVVYVEKNE